MSQFFGSAIAVIRDMEKARDRFTQDYVQDWPCSRVFGSVPSVDDWIFKDGYRWQWHVWFKGVRAQKVISGITKDDTGAPLGDVEITAYRTAADVANSLLADAPDGFCISGPSGEYAMSVPNSDPHYLVGYKPGATPVAGTTLDTLTGV